MSTFFNLGTSIHNKTHTGGYKSWKGSGISANPVGTTAGQTRPVSETGIPNNQIYKFGSQRPISHYRRGISHHPSTQVKTYTGNNRMVTQLMEYPGGSSIKPFVGIGDTGLISDCITCPGISLTSEWQPIISLSETPEPNTQSKAFCCNPETHAIRRVTPANTNLPKKYFTTHSAYWYNRCKSFQQQQFNYIDSGIPAAKPGGPLSITNTYNANCVPCKSTPDDRGCSVVSYKPNNYKFAHQGAVSSSARILQLTVNTLKTKRVL